jgi:hypothetical protein
MKKVAQTDETASKITKEDVDKARDTWRKDAQPKLKNLLDATKKKK